MSLWILQRAIALVALSASAIGSPVVTTYVVLPHTTIPLASVTAKTAAATSHAVAGAYGGIAVPPARTSAAFILWVIQSLLIGSFLLFYGKRGWRATCGIGVGLALELLVWIAVIESIGVDGFSSASRAHTDIIIWSIVTVAGLLGVLCGAVIWPLGMVCMAGTAGLSLAFSIAMMGDNDLPSAARWILVGVVPIVFIVVGPLFQKTLGMALATSFAGSFLIFFAIDLLVNIEAGQSLGLRYLMDKNDAHSFALQQYIPPVSTRVLLALSWVAAVLLTLLQTWAYRGHPFIRTPAYLDAFAHDKGMSRVAGETTSDRFTEVSGSYDTIASRLQRRYQRQTGGESSNFPEDDMPKSAEGVFAGATFALLRGHAKPRLTSPDSPPSRPSSIISTSYAEQLKSRPPTFFNEPLGTPPTTQSAPPLPLTTTEDKIQEVSLATASPAPALGVYRATDEVIDESGVLADKKSFGDSGRSSSSGTSGRNSKASRKSWRKPVPPVPSDTTQLETSAGETPSSSSEDHGAALAISKGIGDGLTSGRDALLPPLSDRTSSSGHVSTILGKDFGSPSKSTDKHGEAELVTLVNSGLVHHAEESEASMRTGDQLVIPRSPEFSRGPPRHSLNGTSGNLPPESTTSFTTSGQTPSFQTARPGDGSQSSGSESIDGTPVGTPDLTRSGTPTETYASDGPPSTDPSYTPQGTLRNLFSVRRR